MCVRVCTCMHVCACVCVLVHEPVCDGQYYKHVSFTALSHLYTSPINFLMQT